MNKTIFIVTGMSGAGKTQVIKTLQDNGFYCIDNLPLTLFNNFMELLETPSPELGAYVALGIDLRDANLDEKFPQLLETLKKSHHKTRIIFVDARDDVLIRRFTETRRPHPLSPKGTVAEGLQNERKRLAYIKDRSDVVIDTSNFTIHDLRDEIVKLVEDFSLENKLIINLVSFGFSRGIPPESSLVFDVRFLPNPYFVGELKEFTGLDKRVADYVLKSKDGMECLNKLMDLIDFLLPHFKKEGRTYLTISIGCTGGRHRSVSVAEEIYGRIKDRSEYKVNIFHRDLKE